MNYYDRNGSRITRDEWGDRDRKQQRVALTTVGKYQVSTVWLGLDHSFDEGRPLIFETMVFNWRLRKDRYQELYCERYSTEAEAIAGHERVVQLVRDGGIENETK